MASRTKRRCVTGRDENVTPPVTHESRPTRLCAVSEGDTATQYWSIWLCLTMTTVARRCLAHGAAVSALLATAAVLTNLALMLAAVDLDVARLHAFSELYDVDPKHAPLLVASTIADAAFYLFLIPVGIALAAKLTSVPSSACSVRVARVVQMVGAVVYALSGAAGALTLTMTWPGLFARVAAGDDGAAARFELVSTFVFHTVWHQVGSASGALWWLFVAITAPRAGRYALAALSSALCLASLAELIVTSARLEALASAVLTVNLALLPTWALGAAAALWPRRARRS